MLCVYIVLLYSTFPLIFPVPSLWQSTVSRTPTKLWPPLQAVACQWLSSVRWARGFPHSTGEWAELGLPLRREPPPPPVPDNSGSVVLFSIGMRCQRVVSKCEWRCEADDTALNWRDVLRTNVGRLPQLVRQAQRPNPILHRDKQPGLAINYYLVFTGAPQLNTSAASHLPTVRLEGVLAWSCAKT